MIEQSKSPNRYAEILAVLQLPPDVLERVLVWLPGRIQDVQNLRDEKLEQLSPTQSRELLSQITNAAQQLECLINKLTSGRMTAHELALIKREQYTEGRFAEMHSIAHKEVERDFVGVRNIKLRAAMMNHKPGAERKGGNAARPEVSYLTNETRNFWRKHLAPPKSSVALLKFMEAIFQFANLMVGHRAIGKRLGAVQQNSQDPKPPVTTCETASNTSETRRRKFIDALVKRGFDEESAIEIADTPDYRERKWDFDLDCVADHEESILVEQARRM